MARQQFVLDHVGVQQLLGGIGDSFYAVDRDWTIVHMNPGACEFFQVRPEVAVGTRLWDLLPAVEGSLFGDTYRTTMSTRLPREMRGESPTFPGRWLEVRCFVLNDGIGVSFREVTSGREVATRLHQQEQRLKHVLNTLRDSEARYKAALKAGRMGSWESNFATHERHWTDEGMALFGLHLPGGIGHVGGEGDEYLASVHPDDRHLIAHYRQLARETDSFPAEYRIVRDGSVIWVAGRGEVIERAADGCPLRLVNVVYDITDRKAAEEQIKLLLRELSHRSKNLLAIIQSISHQTGKRSTSYEDFQRRFELRLQALAASHDLLVSQDWRGVSLRALVGSQIEIFTGADSGRFEMSGPDVFVTPSAAQSLGLALHELGSNAAKYGALASDGGTVSVSWTVDRLAGLDAVFSLAWVETGAPARSPAGPAGFGSFLLGPMIRQSLSAAVRTDYGPSGMSWSINAPLAAVTADA